jgi:molybdenum cofactor guanylyltransferase
MFHPYEIAFCGLSGSGKTTLVTRLLAHVRAGGRAPGYFKHGCHRFDLDRPGKDSFLARQAGAVSVMIADPEKEAVISETPGGLTGSGVLDACDLLFIEGLKELPIRKLLVVDPERAILPHLESGAIREILALVHDGRTEGLERYGLPLFHRDDIQGISAFIDRVISGQVAATPCHGLVLAGGQSSRMGSDKALLNYRSENQLVSTAALLSETCRKVFVSCRREQAESYECHGLPAIADDYLGLGPLGGLLSAQRRHPDAAWFVVACDFPLLDAATLARLAAGRDPLRYATAFLLPGSSRPEPLCTIYEPKSRKALLRRHADGDDSLADFLSVSRIAGAEPPDAGRLLNINTREAMHSAMQRLKGGDLP